MRDQKRQRTIQVRVDRQCEVPDLKGTESLEDMTMATEITSFAREGDAYVLQGYIEMIGFASSGDGGWQDGWTQPEGFLFDAVTNEGGFRRIEQRLPYELRVRADDQESEVLRVKAKLGAWDVHLLGPGLLHIRADLIVEGLSGSGYYFRCGDQEEGVWPEAVRAESERKGEAGEETGELQGRKEADGDEVRGEDAPVGPNDDLPSFDFEAGHENWETPSAEDTGMTAQESGWAVYPDLSRPAEGDEPSGSMFGMGTDSGHGLSDEHEEGSKEAAAEGTGAEVRDAGDTPSGESLLDDDQVASTAVRAGRERPDAFAWSKLYAQGSEKTYATVTFRLVQEEESLRGIAEEYRVPVAELMRLNGLSQEVVHAGQWLVVPGRRED
ncbi:MAG: LysM peptidoglycan-binding domain-containing protein [Alicyclobacillaceae bacterium]|nr:LysM peptidoglycan-binding domain-containing protein [Alicyclobacillaceae bacterium]